ncbi:hypothetical protein ACIKT0_00070 [Hansschlegelia beijingensis]
MTLFTPAVLDALTSAGVANDKAMAVAMALTPQPPGSDHQPVLGDFAVFDALRAVGVPDDKARSCAIALGSRLCGAPDRRA